MTFGMHARWFAVGLGFIVLVGGCAQQQASVSSAEIAQVAGETPPAPRENMETAPDLYESHYEINADTLSRLREAGLSDLADAASVLEGEEFTNSREFRLALENEAGLSSSQAAVVMRYGLNVDSPEDPAAPAGLQVAGLILEGEDTASSQESVASAFSTNSESLGMLYFDFDKSEIREEFLNVIRENARILIEEQTEVSIVIEGHCDERGTNEYNLALGERRAQAVRRAMLAQGVPAFRMRTISYGEERPLDFAHNEGAWSQNRRADIILE